MDSPPLSRLVPQSNHSRSDTPAAIAGVQRALVPPPPSHAPSRPNRAAIDLAPYCQTGVTILAAHLRKFFQMVSAKCLIMIGPTLPRVGSSTSLVIDQPHSQASSPPTVVSSTILDAYRPSHKSPVSSNSTRSASQSLIFDDSPISARYLSTISATSNPTAAWIAGQVTDAFPWDEAPSHLIRDRDGAYGPAYTRRIRAIGIRDRPTAPRSPWQNGHVERLIGSIRRESLDHLIVFSEAHFARCHKGLRYVLQ